jgi:hypothetical protein
LDSGKYAQVTLAADTSVHKIVIRGLASSNSVVAARQSSLTVQLLEAGGAVVKEWTGVNTNAPGSNYSANITVEREYLHLGRPVNWTGTESPIENPIRIESVSNETRLSNDSNYSVYNFGTPVVGKPRMDYVLCWGHNPQKVVDYNVEIDNLFILNGPDVADYNCTLGIDCTVGVSGVGLDRTMHWMLLIDNGEECGSPNVTVANFSDATLGTANRTWRENPRVVDAPQYYSATWTFGSARRGFPTSNYTICWAPAPIYGDTDLTVFNVRVGAFDMAGPYLPRAKFECRLSLNCELSTTGHRLADTNRLLVIQDGVCGNANATPADWEGLLNRALTANGTYTLGTLTRGLPGYHYRVCWGHDPQSLLDFQV